MHRNQNELQIMDLVQALEDVAAEIERQGYSIAEIYTAIQYYLALLKNDLGPKRVAEIESAYQIIKPTKVGIS